MSVDLLPFRFAPDLPTDTDPAPFVVDAKGLSARLGCSVRTIRKLDAAGQLPKPFRVAGRVLWDLHEIRLWVAARCPTRAEWETRRASRLTIR
jgi:predicted DNA-binding transcriptional regulator AlpA